MPTYDYECKKCGRRFEVFQRMTDNPLTICPTGICEEKEWGRGEVRRLLSGGTGLIFKGSGFYITDYSKKSSSGAGSNSNGEKPAKESKPAAEKSSSNQIDSGSSKTSEKKK
ncbi:MAG: zinc ribbon domain-containing protein [Candidatus Marinimicrobia bacterium]|nr:zinc ribbon domain-containing protein [Candidatus Neomarinimicrobiota bacterium]MCF7839180.1 zinc ribbon domain-containing protein [Candidatus Neomarinimicrobiota bacterium]